LNGARGHIEEPRKLSGVDGGYARHENFDNITMAFLFRFDGTFLESVGSEAKRNL